MRKFIPVKDTTHKRLKESTTKDKTFDERINELLDIEEQNRKK